jgi:rhodanese-related sulfurtransferase
LPSVQAGRRVHGAAEIPPKEEISMKAALPIRLAIAAVFFAFAGTQAAPAADAPVTPKEGWYKTVIDLKAFSEYAVIPTRDDVVVIDSRPARKYDEGHIPGAINIPDTFFDKKADLLPKDKGQLLIFYCGGVDCPLSHKSAFKAEKLGYTNIKVFAEGDPAWAKAGRLISISEVVVKELIDSKANAMIVDARPTRVFEEGAVPTSINIPDTFFDKKADLLPKAKDTLLVFYCGGDKCPLSPKSAEKAKALGYTNVKLFQAGYPAWKQAYGAAPAAGAAAPAAKPAQAAIEAGPKGDTITVASFNKIMAEAPDSIMLVDVRDAGEFAKGHMKGAVNIPVGDMMDKAASLPAAKPIVFVCATGARSGEAYDIVKMDRKDLKMYFVDAPITYRADGSYEIKAAAK